MRKKAIISLINRKNFILDGCNSLRSKLPFYDSLNDENVCTEYSLRQMKKQIEKLNSNLNRDKFKSYFLSTQTENSSIYNVIFMIESRFAIH